MIRNGKDEESEEHISLSKKQEQKYKQGLRGVLSLREKEQDAQKHFFRIRLISQNIKKIIS